MSLFDSLIFFKDNADFKLAEMMIVFIYDTSRCRKEEDDPADAVMYFHPAWVSPTQRLALAGQLMGVNHFLSSAFSPPALISLQGGKFVLKKFGRYILAVGTDRNIQDWILERRANTLESILKFFHRDLETISSFFNNDRNKFTEKLYQMLETYLPILQYSANLFSNIPMIKLPKGASNVFLEAMQVLEYCQETRGIMGGALFYNNKVVATQLSADLTKQLVITDPYRIKAPAERVPTSFHLPLGVQLLRVYVQRKPSTELPEESTIGLSVKTNSSCYSVASEPTLRKTGYKKMMSSSGMKRDNSRIFTVPEEGESSETTVRSRIDNEQRNSPRVPPTSLPIDSTMIVGPFDRKSSEPKMQETRSKYGNAPSTPSVCSTPLKDVNRVLHGTAVSICSGNEDAVDEDSSNHQRGNDNSGNEIPDVVKEALRCKRLKKLRNSTLMKEAKKMNRKIGRELVWERKSSSLWDLGDWRQESNDSGTSLGYPNSRWDEFSPDRLEKRRFGKPRFSTITDPCYPVFRNDGRPVSRSLYDRYIASHYQDLVKEQIITTKLISGINGEPKSEIFDDEYAAKLGNVANFRNIKNPRNFDKIETRENSEVAKTTEQAAPTTGSILNPGVINVNRGLDVRPEKKNRQENYRRSMSLPLKSLNAPAGGDNETDDRPRSTSEGALAFDSSQRKYKKLEGLQLTPLMSKLSLLAADERTSGFCSRDTTPGEYCDSLTTISRNKSENTTRNVGEKSMADEDSALEDDLYWLSGESSSKDQASVGLEKTELFVCGHHNMVLFLLMQQGTGNNPDLVHNLWETCVNTLGRLESRLQQCLDPLPSNENRELYSVLSVDPQWDTLHRSGLWGVTELEVVSSLHDRFTKASNLTDIIVRTEDMVVYGSQCGKTQIFYQQAMAPNVSGGLPTPADLMGVVPLKAKRRLERDHGIILF